MLKNIFFLSFLFLGIACCNQSFAADAKITDQTIREAFNKSDDLKRSHTVMIEQEQRLLKVMDAFLKGDTATIRSSTEAISKDMQAVALTYPSSPEKEAEAWKVMAEIVRQSHAMRDEASKNDYQKAYSHFMLLSNQCIQCHQSARLWGKLPEPPAEPAATPDSNKK